MQIMLATQPDTFTNALLNTNEHKHSAIGKHFLEAHGDKTYLMRVNFAYLRSATDNLTAMFTKCYLSKNLGLALTPRVTPFLCYFNDLLFFLVFLRESILDKQ